MVLGARSFIYKAAVGRIKRRGGASRRRLLASLLLLVGVGLGPAAPAAGEAGAPVRLDVDADGVQRGAVILDSHLYRPDHLIVQVGKPVELVLASVTLITPHNFVLDAPDAGLDVRQEVGAGENTIVRFTPSKTGVYPFYCDKQLLFFASHREKGMEGRLEVRE